MTASRTRTRQCRRDRRKAKASDWRRTGTTNPKKVGHHPYDGHGVGSAATKPKRAYTPHQVGPADVTALTYRPFQGLTVPKHD